MLFSMVLLGIVVAAFVAVIVNVEKIEDSINNWYYDNGKED